MTRVRLRADLANAPGYVPGRRPDQLESTTEPPIKLSSNETPFPPLPGVVDAVTAAAHDLNRYPDPTASQLRHTLAQRFGVTPDRIVAGCGSVELCELLMHVAAGSGDEIVYGWRSFEAYPILTRRIGAVGVQVPNNAEHGLDVHGIYDAITPRTRAVFLTTPNNPTGTALTREDVEKFLDAVPDDLLVVLDEAYAEFVQDPEIVDGVRDAVHTGRENVVVLRTLSKAWGLAGARVGYMIMPPSVAAAVQAIAMPFSVSHLAEAAAVAALAPEAEREMHRRAALVAAERDRVHAALPSELGVPESHANFLWLPLGERSTEVANALESHGVITRCFAGDGVRITIGTREESNRWVPHILRDTTASS